MNVGLRRFHLWWRLDHDASEVGNDELSCACSSSAFLLFSRTEVAVVLDWHSRDQAAWS